MKRNIGLKYIVAIVVFAILAIVLTLGISSWIITSSTKIDVIEITNIVDNDLHGLLPSVDYDAKYHKPEESIVDLNDSQQKTEFYKKFSVTYYKSFENSDQLVGSGSMYSGFSEPGNYKVKYVNTESNIVTVFRFVVEKASPNISYSGERVYYTPFEDDYDLVAKDVNGNAMEGTWVKTIEEYTSDYLNSESESRDSHKVALNYTFTPSNSAYYKVKTDTVEIPLYSVAKNGSKYYSRIENALSKASSGNKITILMDTNPIIYGYLTEDGTRSATIPSGVTLFINYNANETANDPEADIVSNGQVTFITTGGILGLGATITTEPYDDRDYSPNIVTIYNNVILYVNGTLDIGGRLASGVSGIRCGHTSTDYSILLLKSNSKVISNGTINCQGFILESCDDVNCNNLPYTNNTCSNCLNNGSELILQSGKITLPFIVKDLGDGNTLAAFKNALDSGETTPPFNQFTFENITTLTTIHNSTTVQAVFTIYSAALKTFAPANTTLISNTGNTLIKLYTGSYIQIKNNLSIISFDFYGDFDISSLKLSASMMGMSLDVDTSKTFLPVSWQFKITLNAINNKQTIVNSSQMLKLMPGSKLTINENVIFSCTDIVVYELYNDVNNVMPRYPADKQSAKLEVGGSLSVNNIGGYVYATSHNSTVEIKNSASVISKEALVREGSLLDTQITAWTNLDPVGLKMPLDQSNNRTVTGKYKAVNQTFNKDGTTYYYWGYYLNYTISFNTQPSNINIPSIVVYDVFQTNGGYREILEEYLPTTEEMNSKAAVSYLYYHFVKWYLIDSNGNKDYEIVGDLFNSNITIYAEWAPINYTIIYNDSYDEVAFGNEIPTGNRLTPNFSTDAYKGLTTINIESAIRTLPFGSDVTHESNYAFNGWYFNGTKIETLDPATIVKYAFDNNLSEVIIYSNWYPTGTDIYSLVYMNGTTELDRINNIAVKDNSWPNDLYKTYDFVTNNSIPTEILYFNGWRTISNKIINSLSELDKTDVNANNEVILVADFVEKKYQVTVNYNGLNGSESNPVYYSHTDNKYDLPTPEHFQTKYVINNTTNIVIEIYEPKYNTTYSPGQSITLIEGNPTTVTLDKHLTSRTTYYRVTLSASGSSTISISPNVSGDNNIIDGSGNTLTSSSETAYVRDGSKISIKFTHGRGSQQYAITDASGKQIASGGNVTSTTLDINSTSYEITAYSECITGDTLITLFDGSKKMVKDLLATDLLLVFNHETGKYEGAHIIFNDFEPEDVYRIINLKFSDETIVKVVYEHGFFDLTLNKYVYIGESNMNEYIGHMFYQADYDGTTYTSRGVELVDAYITEEFTTVYSPITVYHFNYFTESMISLPAGIEGLFNIFEFGENLTYDQELMQKDIETYGLFTYEDFAQYVDYEVYCLFPAQYFKVAIGKGLITFEEIEELIYYYFEKFNLMK